MATDPRTQKPNESMALLLVPNRNPRTPVQGVLDRSFPKENV